MRKTPQFIGIHANPKTKMQTMLGMIPFIIVIIAYIHSSDMRRLKNPDDKLLPSVTQMAETSYRMAFVKDRRTEEFTLLEDTKISLKRFGIGLLSATIVGLLIGLNMGLFRGLRALLYPFIQVTSMIPPMTILPILLIYFGVEEQSKYVLIFFGLCPAIALDLYLTVSKIPTETITKALTLGASQLAVVYRISLPLIIPRVIETVILSFGTAWTFLLAAEGISSTSGIGYRIFLAARYLAMDQIIPYILWATFLSWLMKTSLTLLLNWRYGWYLADKE